MMKNIFNSNTFSLMVIIQVLLVGGAIFCLFIGIGELAKHESYHEELVSRIQPLELFIEEQEKDRVLAEKRRVFAEKRKNAFRAVSELERKALNKKSEEFEKAAENAKPHRLGR